MAFPEWYRRTIVDRFREIRAANPDMTQTAIADFLGQSYGLSPSTVFAWVRRDARKPPQRPDRPEGSP